MEKMRKREELIESQNIEDIVTKHCKAIGKICLFSEEKDKINIRDDMNPEKSKDKFSL